MEFSTRVAATPPQTISIGVPDQGEWLDPNGEVICKVPAEATGGAYSVLEQVLPPGGGTRLHAHHREDILLTVVEGNCELVDGWGPRMVLPGSVVRLPKHARHALRNASNAPCRLIITAVPGGLEKYFEVTSLADAAGEATPERLAEIARAFEIEFFS
jgi:mannose-6-phosphate isomerase-like protein (cupin superfamily)